MLISDIDIINDGINLLSRQLKFYCWQYKRDLDKRQQLELITILNENYFERLANKIKFLLNCNITDCRQQIGKLLFEHCLSTNRRHQLVQLIESDLLDINVRLDNYGRTLLHTSASKLDVDLVKLLIEHKVNIKLRDHAGNTALHIAVQSFRNGALISSNETEVAQNLNQIIRLLLEADKRDDSIHAGQEGVRDFSPIGATSPPHPFEDVVSIDESHLTKESYVYTNQQGSKLINDSKDSHYRDVTICRMLGSHCLCNSKSNINNQERSNQAEQELRTTMDTSESKLQDGIKAGVSSVAEESTMPLVYVKNAFGRTALHYCVLIVDEKHLDQTVELLISYGADVDALDNKLRTPLHCLVKRPGIAITQRCRAIRSLVGNGCDDLGLAISRMHFAGDLMKDLVNNTSTELREHSDEAIFVEKSFKRVPTLKHLARLKLIRINDNLCGNLRKQVCFPLPDYVPKTLNIYVNRKVLDQSELI